jgi:prepilin signal peptidase PulO-like enzyme (type II secretory pathway)
MELMIVVILGLFGLVFGSFVNALVWRLHEQEILREKKKTPTKAQLEKFSMMHGRSMCSNCHHELAAKDLVPVLSWLYLRGKCRYCHKPIQDPPLIEVATGALFALSYAAWPLPLHGVGLFELIVWLAFVVMFVALTLYDLKWFLLPDKIVYPLILLAALEVIVVAVANKDAGGLLNAALGGIIISGIFYALFQLSGGAWIGGGDVKLAVVLGLLAATPLKALLVMFLSSVIGTICSIPILLKGKKGLQAKVPYGPFLLAATVVVVLWGQQFIDWYTTTLLG